MNEWSEKKDRWKKLLKDLGEMFAEKKREKWSE